MDIIIVFAAMVSIIAGLIYINDYYQNGQKK